LPVRALWHGASLLATGQLGQFQQLLQTLGPSGPVVSIVLLVAQAVALPLPTAIIMVANGLAFGPWRGALVSLVGTSAGAFAAYAMGRWIGRGLAKRCVSTSTLRWADQFMAKYGGWAIVTNRWIPGVPLDPLSYAAGLTLIPVLWFLALTVLGLLPATLAAAYLGAQLGGDIPTRYWVSGLNVVATIWFVSRMGRPTSRSATATTSPTAL
jgi:uncharacterized membrane protein YdjX (TVP38/TMEM64 family)